jgi:hypothetical protein
MGVSHEQALENHRRAVPLLHRRAPFAAADLHAGVELRNDERLFALAAM